MEMVKTAYETFPIWKKTWLLKEVSGNIQQVASVFFLQICFFFRIFFYAKATQEYTITVRPKQEVRKVMDYQIYSDTLDQVCGQGTKITTKIHLSTYSSAASSRIATFWECLAIWMSSIQEKMPL